MARVAVPSPVQPASSGTHVGTGAGRGGASGDTGGLLIAVPAGLALPTGVCCPSQQGSQGGSQFGYSPDE